MKSSIVIGLSLVSGLTAWAQIIPALPVPDSTPPSIPATPPDSIPSTNNVPETATQAPAGGSEQGAIDVSSVPSAQPAPPDQVSAPSMFAPGVAAILDNPRFLGGGTPIYPLPSIGGPSDGTNFSAVFLNFPSYRGTNVTLAGGTLFGNGFGLVPAGGPPAAAPPPPAPEPPLFTAPPIVYDLPPGAYVLHRAPAP